MFNSPSPRVLIADVDAASRKLLHAILGAEGYEIVDATRGDEVLARLTEERIDLVLLDMNIPDTDGLDVLRRIRSRRDLESVPIVMLASGRDAHLRLRALNSGAEDSLTKPVERLELRARLHNLIRLRRTNEALENQNRRLHELVDRRTEHLRAFLESAPNVILRVSSTGQILFANRPPDGIEHSALVRSSAAELWVEADRPGFLQATRDTCEQGTGATIELRRLVDGGIRTYTASFGPLQVPGEPANAVVALVDVTEQRASEQARRKEAARSQALLDALPDVVVRLSARGTVVDASVPHGADIDPALFAEGRPIEHVVAPNASSRARETFDMCHATSHPQSFVFDLPDAASNEGRTIEARLGPGEGDETVMLLRDITVERRAQDALERSREQLQQAQKMETMGAFAGGIAHDFNNLLTSIISFTRFVHDDLEKDDPKREDLAEVLHAADTAARLTGRLLAISKGRPVEPVLVDVEARVCAAAKLLQRTLGESVEFIVVPADQPLVVQIDPGQLEQIVFNLAVNARDAMSEIGGVGPIVLRLDRENSPADMVVISVTDTGCGIDEDSLRRVFDPFFSTKGERGTGLGLATCKAVAEKAGGSIEVESVLGEGTKITVRLPFAAEATWERCAEITGVRSTGPRRTGRVLLVEDQPVIMRLMERVLTREGFDVEIARTAEEGLALYREQGDDIALVLTDVVLPGITGLEMLRRLRLSRPGLAAVVCSGFFDEPPVLRSDSGPPTLFVAKPFTPRELLAAMHAALDASGDSPRGADKTRPGAIDTSPSETGDRHDSSSERSHAVAAVAEEDSAPGR